MQTTKEVNHAHTLALRHVLIYEVSPPYSSYSSSYTTC